MVRISPLALVLLFFIATTLCSVAEDILEDCGGEQKSTMLENGESEGCKATDGQKTVKKVALVLGASGETGKEVLKQLVNRPEFSRIVSIGRKQLDLPNDPSYERVEQKVVDFDNLEKYSAEFEGIDAAFCCLGTTRAKSGAEGFVKVDHDYVLQAAKLLKANHCPEFHLLTSKGSNENSWLLFPSTKGKVENDVTALDFDHLSIYRPGLLLCDRKDRRFFENILQSVARYTDKSSWWSVPTDVVASAMVITSLKVEKEKVNIVEHDRIVTNAQND
eukprot:GFUD01014928.1.p1 GENE.GFUD01014928.1~~GFUD01014928.1.p1  ORF type:complete len:276 (+),score=83.03 GFUD01014928.1:38-865(+)